MKILDRYLFVIVANAIFAVLLVILGIDLLAMLIDELGETQANYGLMQVLFYIFLKLPVSLTEFAGYAALIGVMIGLGVISNSGELTVIRASGVSLPRVGWMVMKPALVLILLSSFVAEFVAPTLEQKADSQRSVLREEPRSTIQESGLWLFDKGSFIHVNAVYPNGRLFGLSRYEIDLESAELYAAQSEEAAYREGSELTNSGWNEQTLHWTRVNRESVAAEKVPSQLWLTDLRPELLNMSVLSAEQMSVRDLSKYSEYLEDNELKARKYRVEFWRKLLAPLSIASLVFVGMSFVLGSNRQVAVGERIFIGVIVGTVFQLLQDIFGPASVVWGFPAFWAVFIPIVITTSLGLLLIRLKA